MATASPRKVPVSVNSKPKPAVVPAPDLERTPAPPAVPSIQAKFVTTRKEMNAALIERDDEIDLALTGLIAQQHLLLVGPPGTAKSLVVESVRQWIDGAKSLTVHCCKDTTRNVAFGPVKLSALKDDRTERALAGGAADVHVLILEEVFKAGPAVLDMFLMLMNERVYREGLVAAKAPLRLLLGVSNEWSPEGCETALAAFFDRFLLRRAVQPIRTQEGLRRLIALPVEGVATDRSHAPKLSTSISLEEIDRAHADAMKLEFSPDAGEGFMAIHKELCKEGIIPGDRRLKQSVTAVQAFAYLTGSPQVTPDHLEVLAHCLWVDPAEQPQKAAAVVARIANPSGMKVNALLLEVEQIIAEADKALTDRSRSDVQRATSVVAATTKLRNIYEQLIATKGGNGRAEKAKLYVRQQAERIKAASTALESIG
jgi:MoxR-like ATPase